MRAGRVAEAAADAPRRRRRIATLAGVLVLGALLAALAWVGVRGWLAKGELEQVQEGRGALSAAIAARDSTALATAVADTHAHAVRAAELTSDPLWHAAEILPLVGANATAARVSAESVRDLSAAATPLVEALQHDADAASPGLDLSLLDTMGAPLRTAADAATDAEARLSALDQAALLPPLRSGVASLLTMITGAAPMLGQAADIAAVAPAMLGSNGPREFLVMVQNTAEARTGGGITGSFIAVHAADGRLSIGEHADSSSFTHGAPAVARSLPDEVTSLYGADVGEHVTNITVMADFDTSARLASAWWQTLGYAAPDTVISIDPAVLAALLRVTGPITLGDGTVVDADTVTHTILVRPYLEQSQEGQTAIQTDLTQRLFEHLLATPFDAAAWAGALAAPVAEGRVSIWSAHDDEEATLASGPFGGTLARYRAAGDDAIGVYFNDTTTGKMDTFLDAEVGVGTRVCRADGVAEVDVSVTLTNTAPADARSYPPSMAGAANPSLPGDVTTDVTVTVPTGWFFGGVRTGDAAVASTDVPSRNPSSLARVLLAPGQSQTTVFRFLADEAGETPTPTVVHTPMMNPVTIAPTPEACS